MYIFQDVVNVIDLNSESSISFKENKAVPSQKSVKNMKTMKYIVRVEHFNGKATNPCGCVNIKLYFFFPPGQGGGKMLSHTSRKAALLCLV